ncbi:MAG TPA: YIP1 family protein [Gaiellaceae bacterium]|nr:YIP1 family protein [Gaiellaceae bacterium]
MAVETAGAPGLERSWWLRAPAVLVAPRAVFVSLRDESDEAIEARQEPLLAIAALAGIAGVLATPVARQLLNDESFSASLIPVWAFFGGMMYAVAVYWLGGGLLYGAARRFGGLGSYRRARSLLALSAAPLALALLTLWPLRILIYGQNLFRTGGTDWGPGDRIFGGLVYFAFAWSAILVLVGVRSVHGWSWGRSLATVALAAALPVLIVLWTHFGFGGPGLE